MTCARHWATSAVSLVVAGASMFSACDIDGVTPKCSDAGECLTPPGSVDPGGSGGAGSGGEAGSSTGGSGGATGGTGGSGGSAGSTAGAGGSGGSTAGAAGNAAGGTAGSGGAAGSRDSGGADVNPSDATGDRRGDGAGLDVGSVLDVASLDVRPDAQDGAD
jgi:hypothetical protein